MAQEPFWHRKRLAEMTLEEWESLCDGCGKCCLVKLEDEDSGAVDHTDVACRLLDLDTCRCGNYPLRKRLVPDCVILEADGIASLDFMPSTCAYRLLAAGEPLPWWHPLISGDPETVHAAGVSVRHRVIPETEVVDEDLPDHIVEWPR